MDRESDTLVTFSTFVIAFEMNPPQNRALCPASLKTKEVFKALRVINVGHSEGWIPLDPSQITGDQLTQRQSTLLCEPAMSNKISRDLAWLTRDMSTC